MAKTIMVREAVHCDFCTDKTPMVVWDMPTTYKVWAFLCSECVIRVGVLHPGHEMVTRFVDARHYPAPKE